MNGLWVSVGIPVAVGLVVFLMILVRRARPSPWETTE